MIVINDSKSQLNNCITQRVPEPLHHLIPKRWSKIGDVLILHIDPLLNSHRKIISECLLENIPNIRLVAQKQGPITTWARKPYLVRLAGKGSNETLHKENKCLFKIDPFALLFSPGNHKERKLIPTKIRKNDIIIDMFSGVGQFSIPIAIHAKPQHVYAIEKNPLAFNYLKQNIELNKVQSLITPILGDAINKTPIKVADQVIMGLIPPDPIGFLPKALTSIRNVGTIYFHAAYPEKKLDKTFQARLQKCPEAIQNHITNYTIRVIKKFAPKILHVVIEIEAKSLDPSQIKTTEVNVGTYSA